MKDVENQTEPTKKPAEDDRDEAVREHDRVIYMVRKSQDEKMGSDLLGAAIVLIVLGVLAVGGWALWVFVLSHPAH